MICKATVALVFNLFCLLLTSGARADGAVYAMSNALGNNEVLVYHRAADGSLTLAQTVATGGGGSGLQLAGVDSSARPGASNSTRTTVSCLP